IGRLANEASEDLLEAMKDRRDVSMCELARISFLAVVGPESKDLVPTMLEMYKVGIYDADTEATILVGLGRIGHKEDLVIPVLVGALGNPKRIELRHSAASGLGALGARAKSAVPALIGALDVTMVKDKNRARIIRFCVLEALADIGPDAKAAINAI